MKLSLKSWNDLTVVFTHIHTLFPELPSRVLLDAAVQRVLSEHSYAQLPLNKRYVIQLVCNIYLSMLGHSWTN